MYTEFTWHCQDAQSPRSALLTPPHTLESIATTCMNKARIGQETMSCSWAPVGCRLAFAWKGNDSHVEALSWGTAIEAMGQGVRRLNPPEAKSGTFSVEEAPNTFSDRVRCSHHGIL
jgi:hypothetical protein